MVKTYIGTGRRKTSVAQVRLVQGSGKININSKPINEYFPLAFQREQVIEPLKVTKLDNNFDVNIKVHGGGLTGQIDSCQLGIARALIQYDEELRSSLRGKDLLTRDPRMVERKKYGLKKARKSFQFSKR
jgi:small subunit ribosomal protein S9